MLTLQILKININKLKIFLKEILLCLHVFVSYSLLALCICIAHHVYLFTIFSLLSWNCIFTLLLNVLLHYKIFKMFLKDVSMQSKTVILLQFKITVFYLNICKCNLFV